MAPIDGQPSRVKFNARGEKAFRKLEADRQASCRAALKRFQQNSRHPGLNFEKLRGRDGTYSIRMDRGWRIVLLQRTDEAGVFWEIDAIGPHDIYRAL